MTHHAIHAEYALATAKGCTSAPSVPVTERLTLQPSTLVLCAARSNDIGRSAYRQH